MRIDLAHMPIFCSLNKIWAYVLSGISPKKKKKKIQKNERPKKKKQEKRKKGKKKEEEMKMDKRKVALK